MSQVERIKAILQDGEWHSNFEIIELAYLMNHASSARLSARIYDLKKQGYDIEGKDDKNNQTKYWYRMVINPVQLELKNFGVALPHVVGRPLITV